MADRLAIVGGAVVTPQEVIEGGIVLCEEGKISFVGPSNSAQPEPDSHIVDATGRMILPGFIDTHVHGSGGDDVMLARPEVIRRISRAQLRYGTTAYLPSTIAARHERLLQAIEAIIEAEDNPEPAAEILGLHIEGPYINRAYKGAQPEAGIRDPDRDECQELLEAAPGRIKIMTLAPELPGGIELIRWLVSEGVIASLGHSAADYETALAAIEAGATHATHLYNAMSGVHHRRPGLASACLNEPGLLAEIILDGVHVHPQMARLAWRAKGREGLILVTDATAAQGCPDGIYSLSDFQIQVRGSRCTLLDGVTIAGSVLTMNQALRHAMEFTGMSLVEAAYTASLLPARLCGVAGRKGSIEIGKDADLVVLGPDCSVQLTVRAGEIVYENGKGDCSLNRRS